MSVTVVGSTCVNSVSEPSERSQLGPSFHRDTEAELQSPAHSAQLVGGRGPAAAHPASCCPGAFS